MTKAAFEWNRREFVAGVVALATASSKSPWQMPASAGNTSEPIEIYIVPNFHPASCGWLVDFSGERNYCANNYLDHLDRVRDDSNYAFVISEANNIIAIRDLCPERFAELKGRIREGRVEIVNAYFLESTINIAGGEALVRLGIEGLRWFQATFGVRPRFSWNIDVCGTHEQMAQIVHGLGLDALVYTRCNPTDKTMFWSVSPDGTKVLTLVTGSYSRAKIVFRTTAPLTKSQLDMLEQEFVTKKAETPSGIPGLVLGGSGDYSRAPLFHEYPSLFLAQWAQENRRRLRFATLSQYVDAVMPAIKVGHVQLPVFDGGTEYVYGAFWIENARVKTWYRRMEHLLAATEALSAAASLENSFQYPGKDIYHCWVLMFLNMDRDTLWGGAADVVYESKDSWDVRDRFQWIETKANETVQAAGKSFGPEGREIALFNSLNWARQSPCALNLPANHSLAGIACEQLSNGRVLAMPNLAPMSINTWSLDPLPPQSPKPIERRTPIFETAFYILTMDPATGGIASLKLKPDRRELLGGPANIIFAERPLKRPDEPGDHMPPTSEQRILGTSSDQPSLITASRGPISTVIEVTGTFQGSRLTRSIRLYHDHPRIDFETELNNVPDYTVVYAAFPLAQDITEVRRGIPYGFSHGAWSTPNPALHGWTRGILPAVRWIDFQMDGVGSFTLLNRGLCGHELNGRTPLIYLMNSEEKYWAYPSPWTSGRGKHAVEYALFPHEADWRSSGIPQQAWEYNQEPVVVWNRGKLTAGPFLETSENAIVESMRRIDDAVEVRLVECFGIAGEIEVALHLPHTDFALTDFTGKVIAKQPKAERYRIAVRAQQIVTMRFGTENRVDVPEVIASWDQFVPAEKREALYAHHPELMGHPPFGDHPYTFP